MADARVDVANMALAHVGAAGRISEFDEQSIEAQRINQFWVNSIQSTIRAECDWNFARRYVVGAVLQETVPHWTYMYAWPASCLRVRRLLPEGYQAAMAHLVSGGGYRYTEDGLLASNNVIEHIPYEVLITSTDVRAIAAHIEAPTIQYSKDIQSAELWDPLFSKALAFDLALNLVPSLAPATGRANRIQDLKHEYAVSIDIAKAANGNEGFEDRNREAPWVGLGV